jgi:hypothetical protein
LYDTQVLIFFRIWNFFFSVPKREMVVLEKTTAKLWRRKATAIIAIVLSGLAVVAVFFSHPQQGVAVLSDISSTGVAGIKGGSVGSLDDKLSEILKAEKKAAGAIEVIWKQTNDLPESIQLRDEEEVCLPLCMFLFLHLSF